MSYAFAIVIGRFQPYHAAHHKLLQLAFDRAAHVVVALGGHRQAPTIKAPWTTDQRERMLRANLTPDLQDRLTVVGVRDYLYNTNLWLAELQARVTEVISGARSVALVGCRADSSSEYLNAFPQWTLEELPRRLPIRAAAIREAYFRGDDGWRRDVPAATRRFMDDFAQTEDFARLVEEQQFIDRYKQDWSVAPYPPTFVTVDAVVFKSGHVLVVRRRGFPGKGLLALPGGFVKADETLERAVVRELREETGLAIPAPELRKLIQTSGVFDHPERSLRGRTITHGFLINLGATGALPTVKGGDDADRAFWLPINDVYIHEDRFFEDHVSIITHFANKF